jgi:2-dehydropantoate 2-reductase
MKILVMGAGAVGSAAGGFMAKAGHAVTLIGRADHMDAVRENGLRITGIWGDHIVSNLDARIAPDGLEAGAFDLVIIAVKSYDTAAAIEAAAPLLDENTLVCAYQNGLGNAEIIADRAGWERTIGARVIYGVRIPEPGHADITVIASPTALGVYHPDAPAARVRAIAEAMNDAGLPTVYTDRIATVLWSKVAYNCALNPLSALLNTPYGVLAHTEETRRTIEEVITELYAVGHAMGIELEPASAEEYVAHFFDDLLPPTAAHYASMREDLLRGRRTEIDALNGAVVQFGAEHGAATPVNSLLTRLIHAREYMNRLDPDNMLASSQRLHDGKVQEG